MQIMQGEEGNPTISLNRVVIRGVSDFRLGNRRVLSLEWAASVHTLSLSRTLHCARRSFYSGSPAMATGEASPLHDLIKPLSWLLGKWRSEQGHGKYPTMEDFTYAEEVEFFHVGQPNIQFSMYSWRPDTKKPMAREVGFIRVQPNSSHLGILAVRNLGVATVEEGDFQGQSIQVESQTLGRLSFGKEPQTVKVKRTLKIVGEELEQVMYMQTSNTPMTEHLKICYKRV